MPSKEEIITMKFDALIKESLENELKYRIRSRKNYAKKVVNFSEMSKAEQQQLYTNDKYDFEKFHETITTSLFDATIHDELLHKALLSLKKSNREIILLKYWGEMTDHEIGQALSMSRRMVNHNRNNALKLLKIVLEELKRND